MDFERILDIIENSTGVSIDTRTIAKGDVFFAIKGENFDGNRFVENALEKGAVLAVSSDEKYSQMQNVIVVDNVLKTMQNLSRQFRRRFNIPVIAVTGTNGKTTTKELLCTVLSGKYNVLCTQGNFNNHIGVPLTLFALNKEQDMAVVEMGASSEGEIDFLCNIAEPDFGAITSIGKAHIEGFGSFENIVKTKLELYEYLKNNGGKFFFNEVVAEIKRSMTCVDCIERFKYNDIKGKNISKIEMVKSFPHILLKVSDNGEESINVETKLYGAYNFNNLVTASKIADFFDVDIFTISKKLSEYLPENNRSQILNWQSNTVILDAYNANPTSMMEALKSFIAIDTSQKKYLVLGDMLELGNDSLDEHKKVIDFIVKNNFFEKIILIGNEFLGAGSYLKLKSGNIDFLSNSAEAQNQMLSLDLNESIILAKGSRGIKIESVFL